SRRAGSRRRSRLPPRRIRQRRARRWVRRQTKRAVRSSRQGRPPSEWTAPRAMSALDTLSRIPRASVEFANVILTTPDAAIGRTPRDVIWTHRQTTLYRYRSTRRSHPLPVLLVFSLINRPGLFGLRPGNS